MNVFVFIALVLVPIVHSMGCFKYTELADGSIVEGRRNDTCRGDCCIKVYLSWVIYAPL